MEAGHRPGFRFAHPGYGLLSMSSMWATSPMDGRTPDRVARSAIARSGVQHKASRAAAQYLFLKNWIPDLRGGSATACPGHEATNVIYGQKRHLCGGRHQWACVPGLGLAGVVRSRRDRPAVQRAFGSGSLHGALCSPALVRDTSRYTVNYARNVIYGRNVIYAGRRHLWACVPGLAAGARPQRDRPAAPARSALGRARPR
jgi:hypothetical protein